jgi:hypothetical protein
MDAVKIRVGAAATGFDSSVTYPRASLPAGIHLGIGTAAVIVVAFGVAAFTDAGSVQRVLVMALALFTGAALVPDWRYSLALGVIAYLLYDGFLVNRYGELSWRGEQSLWDILIFMVGYALGLGQRRIRTATAPPSPAEAKITEPSK